MQGQNLLREVCAGRVRCFQAGGKVRGHRIPLYIYHSTVGSDVGRAGVHS